MTPTQPEEVAAEGYDAEADEDTARERIEKPREWQKDLQLVLQDDIGKQNLVYLYTKGIERTRMAQALCIDSKTNLTEWFLCCAFAISEGIRYCYSSHCIKVHPS